MPLPVQVPGLIVADHLSLRLSLHLASDPSVMTEMWLASPGLQG